MADFEGEEASRGKMFGELVRQALDQSQAVIPTIQRGGGIMQNLPRQAGDFGCGNVGEVGRNGVEQTLHGRQ